jgi:hypothetical protein
MIVTVVRHTFDIADGGSDNENCALISPSQQERRTAVVWCAGVTQLVECDLAKVDVAGSNPVSRSILTSLFSVPDPARCLIRRTPALGHGKLDGDHHWLGLPRGNYHQSSISTRFQP